MNGYWIEVHHSMSVEVKVEKMRGVLYHHSMKGKSSQNTNIQ